jgi:choline-sulfatase
LTEKQPNILLIQADQMQARALPCYGNPLVQTPHMDSLAEDGVIFENAYCNNPICAPSRFSMLAGQHTSRIQAYDNGAEFSSEIPTMAHYLRDAGYQTCLSGKMHFVGADQLHGYEERLTTDVYPSDFGWTPDWTKHEERIDWWYHNMDSVIEACPCERTNQIDFDDEVGFQAVRKIYDIARSKDDRPFFLTVSFTNPHDPYACPAEHWHRYDHDSIDMPRIGYVPDEEMDPHSIRLRKAYLQAADTVTQEEVRNARHAYYGQISYVDDKIGGLLKALQDTGLTDDTVIILTADHGDMLGEKGLWYKMSFFEDSVRVPLVVKIPDSYPGKRIEAPVSLVDLLPTLLDISHSPHRAYQAAALDGSSLMPLIKGEAVDPDRPVISEFFAEGSMAPCFMVRKGKYKFICSRPDPDQLFDLETNPDETRNLAGMQEYGNVCRELKDLILAHQDPKTTEQAVLKSQKRRKLVFGATMKGHPTSWDYSPHQDGASRFMRNHLDLNEVERRARIRSKI